jgi:hypothetical protein
MKTFEKICYIYDQIRLVNNEPIAQDGISYDEIISEFEDIKLSPSSLLIKIYEWHNGIHYLDAFLHMLSLEDAFRWYYLYEEIKSESQDFEWQIDWFPILDMNGSVQICVDVNTGLLVAIDIELGGIEVIAQHYENYLDAIFEVFDKGVFIYNSLSGSIDVTESIWQDISSKYQIKNAW